MVATATTGGTVHQQVDQRDQRRYQFNFNIFGQESFAHISKKEMAALLIRASLELSKIGVGELKQSHVHLDAAGRALQEIMGMIYTDPRAPHNATCYLPNKKETNVTVHGEKGWETKSLGVVAPVMRQQAIDAAFDYQPMTEKERDQCAAILRVMRDNKNKLANDKTGVSVRAILERVREILQQLPDATLPPGETAFAQEPPQLAATPEPPHESDEEKPPREGMFLRPRSQLSRAEEDALFDELYPSATPEPERQLRTLTAKDVLETLKTVPAEAAIDRDMAMTILTNCAARAAPWDPVSQKQALKAAERAFWEAAGARQTEEATKEHLRAVSLWGQATA